MNTDEKKQETGSEGMTRPQRTEYEFEAVVTGKKGFCRKGHNIGDRIKVSPLDPSCMCGTAFHVAFPMLLAMDMGAKLPWSPEANTFIVACPDFKNQVVMEVTRQVKTQKEQPREAAHE